MSREHKIVRNAILLFVVENVCINLFDEILARAFVMKIEEY